MSDEPEFPNPTQRAEKPNFLTKTRFDDLEIQPEILAGLKDTGFVQCTPIQAQTLPVALSGKDVAGQAQTGTGKTAVFMVTVFSRLLSLPERTTGLPSALIVAPTRELALQIYEDAREIGRHTGLSLAQVVGGIDYRKQANILRKGADIVICTPGRIIDYIKQGVFKTDNIKVVVIDEADRLFDLGFTKDMRYILRRLPHYEKRQSMLFSATLSYRVLALTYDYMNLPEFISVTPDDVTVEGVDQTLFHVGKKEKLSLLLGLLEKEDWVRVLIFVNTKAGVEWLSKKLKGNKLPAEGITGDLPQPKRLRLMERFKDGSLKILVATDVASRGIHVEDISHAINYDLPQDPEIYIHRIGRTARAGKKGHALSLACETYVFHLEAIEELMGAKIPVVWPEEDWFKKDMAGPVKAERKFREKRPARSRAKVQDKKRTPPGRTPKKSAAVSQREIPKKSTAASRAEANKKSAPASYAGMSKKSATSSQPGGIFGLAFEPKASSDSGQPKKRKIKRRPRKKAGTSKSAD
ncbi:MAG: DEAD/DEAH box helicase [Deltaproteobacteria bacterium]|nr:DEAD/DEAH box helicase [Deltaproteobacteria bacterium]